MTFDAHMNDSRDVRAICAGAGLRLRDKTDAMASNHR